MLRKEAVAAEEPAWWLLGPYDTAIAVPSWPAPVTVRAGRFSLGALNALRIFVTDTPTIITVGSFCEFGQSSLVIVGGNHRNESLLNFTFGDYGLKFFSALPDTDKPIVLTKNDGSPTYIGDNVMVSLLCRARGRERYLQCASCPLGRDGRLNDRYPAIVDPPGCARPA